MRSNRLIRLTLFIILIAAGCNKRVPVAAAPPPPVAVSAPSSAAAAARTPAPLDEADRAFTAGNYDEAARGYDSYLHQTFSGGLRDQALFRMALAYALRPAPDWPRASLLLKQLMDEFPNSSFKPAANLIMSLHSEMDQLVAGSQQRDQRIRQLTTELDRLKKIDADRRKRP